VLSHFFAQWQSVLETSMVLNRLYGSPFSEMPIIDLFDGIFLHNVYNEVQKKKSISDVLTKQKCNAATFWNLYNAATQDLKDSLSGQISETKVQTKKGVLKVDSTKKPISTSNVFNLLNEHKDEESSEEEQEESQEHHEVEEEPVLPEISLAKEEFKTGGSWADDVESKEQETEVKLKEAKQNQANKAALKANKGKIEKKFEDEVQEIEENEDEEEEEEEEEETSSKKAKPKKAKKKKEKIDNDVLDVLAQLKSIDTKKAAQEKEKAAKKREKKLKNKMKKAGAS